MVVLRYCWFTMSLLIGAAGLLLAWDDALGMRLVPLLGVEATGQFGAWVYGFMAASGLAGLTGMIE